MEFVLHLGPQRSLLKSPLDTIIHVGLGQIFIQAHTKSDVVINGHRERGWFLEDHADPGSQQVQVNALVQRILPVEQYLPFSTLARVQVIHPVKGA